MDLFQRIGNLLSGGGFSNNRERGTNDAARKKREEEERRRKAADAARIRAEAQARAATQKQRTPATVKPVTPFDNPLTKNLTVPINGAKPEPVAPAMAPRKLTPAPVAAPVVAPVVKPVAPKPKPQVNVLADPGSMKFNPNDKRSQGQRQQEQQKKVESKQLPKLDDKDKKTIADYESATNKKAFDKSRAIFKEVLNNPNHPDHARAKRLAPYITTNWIEQAANKTIKNTAKMAGDLAMVPVDVAQSVPKGIIRTVNQVTGNKETKLDPVTGFLLNAKDNKVGAFKDYGNENLTGLGSLVGQDLSAAPEPVQTAVGGLMSLLDLTPLGGAAIGTRIAAQQGGKQGIKQGLMRATGGKNALTQPDIAGAPEAEIASTARRVAEQAVADVPDAVEIVPGIKSPNAARQQRINAEQAADAARQAEADAIATAQAEQAARIAEAQAASARNFTVTTDAEGNTIGRTTGEVIDTEALGIGSGRVADPYAMPDPLDFPGPAPMVAREVDPEVQALEAQAALDIQQGNVAPLPEPDVPTATAVETPIEAQSRQVAPVVVDEAPVPRQNDADTEFASGEVKAATERLDYLKREMAPSKEIKAAERELAAAKADAKESAAPAPKKSPMEQMLEEAELEDPTVKLTRQESRVEETKAKLAELDDAGVARNSKEYRDAKRRARVAESTAKSAKEDVDAEAAVKADPTKGSIENPFKTEAESKAASRLKKREEATRVRADGTEAPKVATQLNEMPPKPSVDEADVRANTTKAGRVSKKYQEAKVKEIMDSDASTAEKTKAIQQLQKTVKKVEGKAATVKQVERDAGNPDLSKVEKRARATLAATEAAVKAKRADKAKATRAAKKAEGELPMKTKGKAGGNTSTFMARMSALQGDPNAKALRDSAPKGEKIKFNEELAKAGKKVSDENLDTAIATAKNLDLNDLNTKNIIEAMTYNTRLADDIARLSKKPAKRRTPAETKQLNEAREAQLDLVEKVSLREADNARSMSLLGHLYKSLDPTMVTGRVVKRIEAAGGRVTKAQQNKLLSGTKELKKAHDANTTVHTEFNDLQKNLTKDSPMEDFALLQKMANRVAKSDHELGMAFDKVNIVSDGIKQDNFDIYVKTGGEKGFKKEKWYGRSLDTYTRAAMLSAPSGRFRDLISSNLLTQNDIKASDLVGSVIGKMYNAVSGRRAVDQKSFARPGVVMSGIREGFGDFKAALQGKRETPRFLTGVAGDAKTGASNFDERSGLYTGYTGSGKKPSKTLSYIHATVALPTYLSKGYRNGNLYKALYDDARKQGFDGKQASLVARARMANPPEEILKKVEYKVKEISGLQAEVGRKINKTFQKWERGINNSNMSPAKKRVAANALTIGKNLTIPFSSYMTGTTKNLLTRQNLIWNGKEVVTGISKMVTAKTPEARDLAAEEFVRGFSQGTVNVAKVTVASTLLAPFISDTDANGKSYTPPYLKFSDDVIIPIGSLGPLGGQLINAWALKRMNDSVNDGTPLHVAIAGYTWDLGRGVANAAGLANLNVAATPLTSAFNQLTSPHFYTDAKNGGERAIGLVSDTVADFATQQIPAVLRDVNSLVEGVFGDGIKPETTIKGADGKKDYVKSGIARVGSGIPGLSQMMGNDEEDGKAANFWERIIGGVGMSGEQKQSATDAETKAGKASGTIAEAMKSDRLKGLLDEDGLELYEKAQKGELDEKQTNSLRDKFIKGADKLIEDNHYDDYITLKKMEKSKIDADPTATDDKKNAIEREVKVAGTLRDNEVDYDLYEMYAVSSKADGGDAEDGTQSGISRSELKKMLDDESEYYDPDLANQLLALDDVMARAGVSDNSSNSKMMKYDIAKIQSELAKAKKSGSGGGGGGSGSDQISTDVGSANFSKFATVNDTMKYRSLSMPDSPIPNLSATAARTNLKKGISVKKGVHL